jgi:hypothetical protein
LPLASKCHGQIVVGHGIVLFAGDRFTELSDRSIQISLVRKRRPQIFVSLVILAIDPESGLKGGDRLIELSRAVKGEAQTVQSARVVLIQRDGFAVLANRLVHVPFVDECIGKAVVRVGIIAI